MGEIGRIHSFESFGTLDGPGIRFVVFMQGCRFRCVYCHNRDTWDPAGGREYTVGQVMDELIKYKDYFKFSRGGVTVSGGEPTLQADFTAELFEECRKAGIHTALDTNGFADPGRVERLLLFTDLVLLDIKHINSEKHKLITGTGNEKPRRFAGYISEKGIPAWIRYVLVPGFTDSAEDLLETANFIKSLHNIEKIEVLPYHKMGSYKWEALGEAYPLAGTAEPDELQVSRAEAILRGQAIPLK